MQTNPVVAISTALTTPDGVVSAPMMRAKIMALEEKIKMLPGALGAKDFKTNHHFGPGVYMRELVIPADMILTGRIHKFAHLNILSKGKITVWTEDGMKTLEAPCVIKSQAGMKRVGYAHRDSVWTTVHHNPTNENVIEKVEAALFVDTFDEFYLSSQKTIDDVCSAMAITREYMREVSENKADQVPQPDDELGYNVRSSDIHGAGIFSQIGFKDGDVIGSARIGEKRAAAGRFCNHSGTPNAEMKMCDDGNVYLVAIQDIEPNTEIFVDYYLTYKNTRPNAALEGV